VGLTGKAGWRGGDGKGGGGGKGEDAGGAHPSLKLAGIPAFCLPDLNLKRVKNSGLLN